MDPKSVLAKHKEFVFPAVINYYQEPLVPERGEGLTVHAADGRRYLDFFGGILTVSVGHSHPHVLQKTMEQMKKLQHVSTLYPTEPMGLLAEKIAGLAPSKQHRWKSFFTSSGTEANEMAVLTAKLATGTTDMIALRHSYGGRATLALNMMGQAAWRVTPSQLPGVKHAHAPYCYRCDFGLTYPDCGLRCAKDVETLIQTETNGRVACLIAEPVLGVGGFIVPPKEYFSEVVPIVRKYGGLFIADEVQTGWGRTGGKWNGIEHWGVVPDMLTYAKGLANGSPIGVTLAKAEVADAFKGLTIATFGGNPVTMAAALATIEVIEKEKLLENTEKVGAHLHGKLTELAEKHPAIGDVRGLGLMRALELVKDRKSKEPDMALTGRFLEATRRAGLLVGKGGLYGNTVRIAPPMVATKNDVDEAAKLLDKALSEATAGA
ncbi:MAG TPA: aspartate aminotransferase family protein [Myxococcales bacterium]|nr:aspartate aminotransferase family protein [Myxococcales bacterium]